MKKVVFTTLLLPHYRQQFHELVKSILASHAVDYQLIYSKPKGVDRDKRDTIDLPWATCVPFRDFGTSGRIIWQSLLPHMRDADLVVIGQENRFLVNYLVQALYRRADRRIALWGHGRNFQARNPDSRSERWKRAWAVKADWWFAYTTETRDHMAALGFPPERITVCNNSVDTSQLRRQVSLVTPQRLSALTAELGLAGRHVGVFVGGIYPDKRMAFLIAAADRIRALVPDFELIIVGGGSDLPLVQRLAQDRPWVKITGPRFGMEKAELMMLGHVFMMPGLMGLAILDAGVAGLPIATTAFPWHSPEIAYLEPGVNGVMVNDWESADAYALEVSALLLDPARMQAMSAAAQAMAERYSIEAMAGNFARGVLAALAV